MANGRRDLRRRDAPRTVERRVLIVTEGTVTEKLYFDAFRIRRRVFGVEVTVVGVGMDPVSVVQRAIRDRDAAAERARRERDPGAAWDEVWCVFDVDDFGAKVPEAHDLARTHGLQVAVSNPCFELWLFLHLQEPPGLIHRHDLQGRLQKIHPAKEKYFDAETILAGYNDAVRRAQRLDEQAVADDEEGRNPTTGVYRLTEAVDPSRRLAQQAASQSARETALSQQRAREAAALAQAREEGYEDGKDSSEDVAGTSERPDDEGAG
jgi:hypothetical protein